MVENIAGHNMNGNMVYSGYGKIIYDPKRPNGYYYMEIKLQVYRADQKKETSYPTKEETLEIILNGPGTNKARKKAMSRFRFLGIEVSNFDVSSDIRK